MNLNDVKDFLRDNITRESQRYFGINNNDWIERVTNNWFDDQKNYDGRWHVIKERVPMPGKILDMAAGCGTFVLYGLNNKYDVWGIEPEKWKREYFLKKIIASKYSEDYLSHIIDSVGETLPFENNSFDLVTTYQTLEHVTDVKKCIIEMIRILKPDGVLYIKAPDYNCFFEPHYRVPFLPRMNKDLASIYLKMIGRPLAGLKTLNWITEKQILYIIKDANYNMKIERTNDHYIPVRKNKIKSILPEALRKKVIVDFINYGYLFKLKVIDLLKIGRAENNIDLWLQKRN